MRKKSKSARMAVLADLHIDNFRAWGGPIGDDGLNARGRLCIGTLERAVRKAAESSELLVIAGDLFHKRRPDPPLIAEVIRILGASPIPVVVFPGNHDLAGGADSRDHALRPLAEAHHKHVEVVHEPKVARWGKSQILLLPFAPGNARERLESVARDADAVIGHYGIWGSKDPSWCENAPDYLSVSMLAALAKRHGWRRVLMGHYHVPHDWKSGSAVISTVGCAIPWSFGDEGILGNLLTVEDGSWETHRQPLGGPRFIKVKRGDPPPERTKSDTFFLRVEDELDLAPLDKSVLGGWEEVKTKREDPVPVRGTVALSVADAVETWIAERTDDKHLRQEATRQALEVLEHHGMR